VTLILLIKAVVLGIVEGLTEFLPVSSTGHLIIAGDAIGFTGESANTFEIFIQLGAILGVVWHYRARVLDLAIHAPRPAERRFLLKLFVAFLPAAILGLLAHRYIKAYLFNPLTVAGALIVGGVVILLVEHWQRGRVARVHQAEDLSYVDALKVGIAQMFSLFPGVSRAGATIIGGLLTGLSRTAATEFSFFLAMPIMFAATFFDLYQNRAVLQPNDVGVFAVGFVVAFITAVFVVRTFLVYVARHTFRPFAWYRIAVGLAVAAYFW
jgi:undecaprenyl-diphosphatase